MICLYALPVQAGNVIIDHRFGSGTVTFEVDDRKINVEQFRRYLVVHPIGYDYRYHVARQLELCIKGDPTYKECGTRKPDAPFFQYNMEQNIRLSKADLAYLDSLNHFPELKPLVQYFRASLRFGLWINERLFAYYRTSNPLELERNYESLPIIYETQHTLMRLKNAASSEPPGYHMAQYEWAGKCVSLYREQEGPVPLDVWARFLRAKGIKETVIYDGVD